jgi:hypothetical protein
MIIIDYFGPSESVFPVEINTTPKREEAHRNKESSINELLPDQLPTLLEALTLVRKC